jgi:hypothetical protein
LAGLQRTRFAYDTQNRLRFTVCARQRCRERLRALGDLATTVRFVTQLASTQYTEQAIDAAVDCNDAANRVQHTVYDGLGQLRFNVQVIEPDVATAGMHWVNDPRRTLCHRSSTIPYLSTIRSMLQARPAMVASLHPLMHIFTGRSIQGQDN